VAERYNAGIISGGHNGLTCAAYLALAGLTRHSPATVNFRNAARAPLLLIAGERDRVVPAAVNRRNHAK